MNRREFLSQIPGYAAAPAVLSLPVAKAKTKTVWVDFSDIESQDSRFTGQLLKTAQKKFIDNPGDLGLWVFSNSLFVRLDQAKDPVTGQLAWNRVGYAWETLHIVNYIGTLYGYPVLFTEKMPLNTVVICPPGEYSDRKFWICP